MKKIDEELKKELLFLISQGEGYNIEFKESFCDEVIETLVAFANRKGGKIILGVNNKGKIIGIKISRESVQKWLNEIKNKTYPRLNVEIEISNLNNRKIAILEIMEFPLKPVSFKNRYFIRKNNSNHILSLQEVADIYLKTKNSSWDFYPDKDSKLNDLDQEKIFKIKNLIEENLETKLGDNLSFLRKYSLIVEEKGKEYPTFASLLLFSKNPLRQTDIQIGLFQTDTIIKKSKVIRNDLVTEVEEVLDFIKSYILKEYIFTGNPRREERWQYPIEALREIIINAVVHRDYREGTHSQFKIYPDKIIFWNVGEIPQELTMEDIKRGNKKSFPRNKSVAEIFRDCGLIERYGSGVKRAIDQIKEYGLPEPEINENSSGFDVIVHSVLEKDLEKDLEKLSTSQKKIIEQIRKNPLITQRKLSEKIGINEKNIRNNIEKLKQKNLLKRIGPDKGGYWEISN